MYGMRKYYLISLEYGMGAPGPEGIEQMESAFVYFDHEWKRLNRHCRFLSVKGEGYDARPLSTTMGFIREYDPLHT